jgi:NAD(P)-dependent dehydrogenase (short-subunit alcohol dehydrogenase family)
MSLNFKLDDKVAIITGGGKGIGKQIALAFARSGANVVVCGRNTEALDETVEAIKKLKCCGLGIKTDIQKICDIKSAVDQTISEFGHIDILVNNAGVDRAGSTLEVTEEDWDIILDTNVKGMFFFCQGVGPYMIKQKKGKIINIGSILSKFGLGYDVPYSASKGAVYLLTKALALEWAKDNIQVNAIGPGYVLTDQVRWIFEKTDSAAKILSRQPSGRVATVEDIEGAAVFLASEASDYVNGEMIFVDGASTAGWIGPE